VEHDGLLFLTDLDHLLLWLLTYLDDLLLLWLLLLLLNNYLLLGSCVVGPDGNGCWLSHLNDPYGLLGELVGVLGELEEGVLGELEWSRSELDRSGSELDRSGSESNCWGRSKGQRRSGAQNNSVAKELTALALALALSSTTAKDTADFSILDDGCGSVGKGQTGYDKSKDSGPAE
jgi:hypothetical protein